VFDALRQQMSPFRARLCGWIVPKSVRIHSDLLGGDYDRHRTTEHQQRLIAHGNRIARGIFKRPSRADERGPPVYRHPARKQTYLVVDDNSLFTFSVKQRKIKTFPYRVIELRFLDFAEGVAVNF
jgi:hypothetical protein